MPIPDSNNIFVAYTFTLEEARTSQVFTDLQMARLQTMRAQYATELAIDKVSPTEDADRDGWFRRIELQTKINFITELFDAHTAALKAMVSVDNDPAAASSQQQDNIGARASKLVHKET